MDLALLTTGLFSNLGMLEDSVLQCFEICNYEMLHKDVMFRLGAKVEQDVFEKV